MARGFVKQNFLLLRISDCERRDAQSIFEEICERERSWRTVIWFVHASVHIAKVIGTEFKDAQNSAALTRLLF